MFYSNEVDTRSFKELCAFYFKPKTTAKDKFVLEIAEKTHKSCGEVRKWIYGYHSPCFADAQVIAKSLKRLFMVRTSPHILFPKARY